MDRHITQSGNVYTWLFVLYIFMSLLPSNSVYVTIFPFFRHFLWALIIVYTLSKFSQYLLKTNGYILGFVFIFFLTNTLCYIFTGNLLSNDVGYLLHCSMVFIFVSLPLQIQSVIYRKFVYAGSFYVFLSLTEYLLHWLNLNYYLATDLERGEESDIVYMHGLFNVYPIFEFPPRFQGLFREPGFLGLCAGIIMFNLHKFKYRIGIPWILGGLFSLSLFFYVFILIAFVYHLFVLRTISLKKNIFIAIVLAIGISVSFPILNEAIILRTQGYVDDGADNRVTSTFNSEYNNLFNSEQYLFGKGYNLFVKNGYTFGNAGVKAEIYKYGLIVVIFHYVGFALLAINMKPKRRDLLLQLFLYLLCVYSVDCKYAIHTYVLLLSLSNYKVDNYNV